MQKKNYIPIIKEIKYVKNVLKKPNWLKITLPLNYKKINIIKKNLRNNKLHSVCEEALCPNMHECFNNNTATFMILGSVCTRKCPFCAVKKGRPTIPDILEPEKLADVVVKMNLKYVVITSVTRDDLKYGGIEHFVKCIQEIRKRKNIKIEILVPDFKNCQNKVIEYLGLSLPDVFNHNIESVPRLYKKIRPGADYISSLNLLKKFKKKYSNIETKSGLMLGLGENKKEVLDVLYDLRNNGVTMLTLGQYLQPSSLHLKVKSYITQFEFNFFKKFALSIGFKNAFCGPLVRSSYHAYDQQKK
ncbi:lipoyl synthase [Buchnera aphidicola]|uniref:Lipoyl synthase n=1 Tax=Buchnera aphidicola (Anoecia oenotherae) TaxID=1241833 RepID=A0A4D6XV23_9GAMM|nr:lipoyl synthase [Buchnera aphidicola]QCI19339.1 lipoyl synthase [Buchnera aphidicola (Anoecia oenotherae)]